MTGQEPETTPLQQSEATKPAVKKKPVAQASTAAEIIERTFAISTDKEQNVKPATWSKTDFKAIVSSQKSGELDSKLLDSVTAAALKTDTHFEALAHLTVAATKCREDKPRQELLAFAVRMASALWINRHRESHNLFQDLLDADKGLYTTPFRFMRNSITALYSKRIEHVKAMTVNPAAVKANPADTPPQLSVNELEQQQSNLQLIGGLWLLAVGKSTPSEAITIFAELLEARRSRNPIDRDIALYLAEQYVQRDSALADTLDYFKKLSSEQASHGKRLQLALEHSEQETTRLKKQLTEHKRISDEQGGQITTLEAELTLLRHRLEEQQLDERARRTHLRDSTGQVKAKAFNLLTEDVLEPLKLSLSALQREKPKTEVAAHHIELAVESIERDIKWFKE
ncbi:hypothetical protein [uncultured Pseudomonas sp.]|uniref:hypothetical protein n=1 Tax=uncultured Pseudomonas sp. TaxID=114707 RepID=UPI0030DD5C31|tara:strand:+ start:8148 stop:9344 length:1197 start_codon:yes stop_codon:yes gene_type:complete